jgi:exonuclease V gamma subunit
VVVDELFEVVEKAAPEKYAAAVEQPLQPWSERRFGDERARPYDDFLVRAAEARRGASERLTAQTPRQLAERPRLPARLHPKTTLTTGDLTNVLTRPQYLLLKGRLGIELYERDQTLEDREPIEPGTYDVSKLAEELAPLWPPDGGAPPIEALEARLRAEGKLLVGEAGRMHLRAVVSAINAVVEERSKLAGTLLEPHQHRVRLEGGVEVSTPLLAERLQTDNGVELVQRVYQEEPQEHVWVQAIYDATVAQASLEGEGRVFAVVVTTQGQKRYRALGENAAEARAALERTAALWERAHSEAVLLFKSTSKKIAESAPQEAADAEAMSAAVLAARTQWHGSSGSKGSVGEREKTWVKPLFGDLTIEDLAAPEHAAEVVALAAAHWAPVIKALDTEDKAKKKPSSGKDKTASDTEGVES